MIIGRIPAAAVLRAASLSLLLLVLPVMLVLFPVADSGAETRYVKPENEALVRRGQGTEFKIVGVVKEGTTVEVIEENKDYSLVRLDNGVEGWILRRYLSVEPPLDTLVEKLRREREELQSKESESSGKLEELSAMLATTQTDLEQLRAERDRVLAEYEQLQRDTADVVKIRNEMLSTAEENKQLTAKMAVLEKENSELKKDRTINWFLAGGGVLFFGILIGKMPSPSRRRKSSLLS